VPTLRATIAYEGTEFHGWARQPALRTVESVLTQAVGVPELVVAGRTDRGVHAAGNVISWSDERVRNAGELNGLLPNDLSVLEVERAPHGFDARADATSRSYVYRILNRSVADPFNRRFELLHPGKLEDEHLQRCAAALVGRHDCTAFTPSETQHVHFRRTVLAAGWERDGDRLAFHITADALLRHMVRIMVGTMLQFRDSDLFVALLEGAPRSQAGRTAPPHGLTLLRVGYGQQGTP